MLDQRAADASTTFYIHVGYTQLSSVEEIFHHKRSSSEPVDISAQIKAVSTILRDQDSRGMNTSVFIDLRHLALIIPAKAKTSQSTGASLIETGKMFYLIFSSFIPFLSQRNCFLREHCACKKHTRPHQTHELRMG